MEGQKNSKTRSLLQKLPSRQPSTKQPSRPDQSAASQSLPVEPPPPPTPVSAAAPSASMHRQTASQQSAQHNTHNFQTPQNDPATVDHSVRMFKLYEALRSGDTNAVSRAIKDTSTPREGDSRPSTSSGVPTAGGPNEPIIHLAIQCAELPIIEYVVLNFGASLGINSRDKDGNTPLHVASMLSRASVVQLLLEQKGINDLAANYQGRTALDLAKSPDIHQQLQLARSLYIDARSREIHAMIAANDYARLERLLTDSHFQSAMDINSDVLATDPATTETGGTLLHEAARKRDAKLIEVLLLNGADPFRRDRKGKLPQDVTKDDRTRSLLKKSPAAAAAQRGIQEKTVLGSGGSSAAQGSVGDNSPGGKEGREMKGYLKKWTNYTTGYKLRWFVLEDGVLSYYKQQDDAGSACRGAINMKIARLHMDAQDKLRFEIIGKSSVKYHLKANHQVEAKRWVWSLNNAIQWTKDQAKVESKRQTRGQEMFEQAKLEQSEKRQTRDFDAGSATGGLSKPSYDATDEEDGAHSIGEASVAGDEVAKITRAYGTTAIEGDMDDMDEDFADDASSIADTTPVNKDAFLIAAQSARVQLDFLSQISHSLQSHRTKNPQMTISSPTVSDALSSFESASANLKGLLGDMGRVAKDRESYWQYKLDREVNVRRLWEASMTKVAREQSALEERIGESEDKRKRTKRALRDALEGNLSAGDGALRTPDARPAGVAFAEGSEFPKISADENAISTTRTTETVVSPGRRRKSTIAEMTNLSDSESGDDEEFFDAVDAGEVPVVGQLPPVVSTSQTNLGASTFSSKVVPPPTATHAAATPAVSNFTSPPYQPAPAPAPERVEREVQAPVSEPVKPALKQEKEEEQNPTQAIAISYKGYEEPVRKRLAMDADNRPKISLWGILKSMIGKDMSKMTLPVSFNEPTSLLQRVAEDMEYTDLLDTAAERTDPTERLVYVAAFAASEYASTIGRVAKPFNPLLGETYEYVRPDKQFRFFIEQVSHHPPIGAAWAEAPRWSYYGESSVRSKFYGKSFDINPLGTWFLRLTTPSGKRELYTWKKVTSSVIGIITGSPTVDNYGLQEVRNHTTGEVCILDFKQRGWKASSAYQVSGKVQSADGTTRWSIGGRWNDKIYARLTPGFEAPVEAPSAKNKGDANQAFLVWEAHPRPQGIPFNLTPFVVTLNALPAGLAPHLPPTDTRLRPDQRAMEDGEYDRAATDKNRVEEKQRAARRAREQSGDEFRPQWFAKGRCDVTGEEFWQARGVEAGGAVGRPEYWACRARRDWARSEDIF